MNILQQIKIKDTHIDVRLYVPYRNSKMT